MILPCVAKPSDFRLICKVDIENLRDKILSVGEAAWNAEDSRKENKFECFSQTRHIIARFTPRNEDPMTFYSTPFWSVWAAVLAADPEHLWLATLTFKRRSSRR